MVKILAMPCICYNFVGEIFCSLALIREMYTFSTLKVFGYIILITLVICPPKYHLLIAILHVV